MYTTETTPICTDYICGKQAPLGGQLRQLPWSTLRSTLIQMSNSEWCSSNYFYANTMDTCVLLRIGGFWLGK